MKRIPYIIAIILTNFISAENIDAQKYFKVLETTSQAWAGGIPQSGTGTSYTIKAVLLTSHEIHFTDAWACRREHFTEAWTVSEYAVPEIVSFSHSDGRPLIKGDTILIRFTIHHYPPESPMLASLPVYKAPPMLVTGEALIRYVAGHSVKYMSITKFKQLPHLNYL